MNRPSPTPVLDRSVSVVVGAGQGIGQETALALSGLGSHVICLDIDAERAEAVAAEVGGTALTADVTTPDGIDALRAAVSARQEPCTAIVDIVGMARFKELQDTTDEDWAWTFDMNLGHAVRLVAAARDLFGPSGGALTVVASVSGITGAQRHGAYGAAKAALMSLMRTAAVELGPFGIRVNAVAPGVVWTPRMGAAIGEAARGRWAANAPLGRVAVPADVAGVAAATVTPAFDYVTGQVVVVDGGVSAKFPYPVETL